MADSPTPAPAALPAPGKQAGINDKCIHQSDDDRRLAFQKAFTLELLFSAVFLALVPGALPAGHGGGEVVGRARAAARGHRLPARPAREGRDRLMRGC